MITWLDWTVSGRSFACSRNRAGPRIEPCGTADVTGSVSDVTPRTVIR